MFKNIPFDRVNWVTSIFLVITALISVTAVPWFIYTYGLDWLMVSLFFFYTVATILSVTLGYHRLFSHLAFKAKWPVRLVTLLFGAAAFQNSCLNWASDHRDHHKHVDHDEDPYDISKGFFYAHIGWLLFKLEPDAPQSNVADLRKDKLVVWQDKWVQWIGLVVGVVVPTIIGYFWKGGEGALAGFLIPGILRITVVQHCTFFINSLCHTIGKQPYNSNNSARDSALMAFFTCGEGYHNYHHSFQQDYRNGVKSWQFDPTKWTIWVLSKLGLASDLRRVADEKILLAEMREAQRLLDKVKEEKGEKKLTEAAKEKIAKFKENLNKRYVELEEAITNKVDLSKELLLEMEKEVRKIVGSISEISRMYA